MPNPEDIPEEQRQSALQAIALVRELSPSFLDKAEQIITNGADDPNELFNIAISGSRIVSAVTQALKPLWIMEDAVFKARDAEIAMMGKEGTNV